MSTDAHRTDEVATRHVETHSRCIGVVTPYLPAVSETFIQAHIEGLPAKVVLVYGWPPSVDGQPVLSTPSRASHKLWRMVSGEDLDRVTTAAYVKAFRHHRVTAVLAEYGTTGVLAVAACRQLGIPLVVHFHGYDASVHAVLQENADRYRNMFREAAAVIAVSQPMKHKLISIGASAEKVHYNPCGIDCREFAGADPAAAPPVFVGAGRFIEKKAPELTLQAFSEVRRAVPEARLRMVGDGPLLDRCRELAIELGIPDSVSFLGAQPHSVVQEEMRRARCFVQHSVVAASGDSEGMPVSILEAGASGLPVVSTRHAGIPDAVAEGETGFLVDEHDVAGMASHMLRVARDPALAGQLGRAAQRRIQASFSRDRSLSRLWTIIESSITDGLRQRGSGEHPRVRP
jgi:colanic acid/amylovoran biosynthesis glycosyltransferase